MKTLTVIATFLAVIMEANLSTIFISLKRSEFCAGGHVRGDIFIDGHPMVYETFARVSGYVEQFDIHSPALTVRESLKHSAQMRLMDVNKDQLEEYIDEVITSRCLYYQSRDWCCSKMP